MDTEIFVKKIKEALEIPLFEYFEETLRLRTPVRKSVESSEDFQEKWIDRLTDEDRRHILELVRESIRETLFGFFSILDGVRPIEDGENKGDLELFYVKGASETLINDIEKEYLHDIYNSL